MGIHINFYFYTDSPFRCNILDSDKVMIKRLEKVAVHKVAQFSVDTNGGLLNEGSIIILGKAAASVFAN